MKENKMAIKNAIGILETKGFAPLVLGADTAVKAANVDVVEWRQVGSGYVSFVIEGDVAAVRAAIDAATDAASRIGEVISQLVIPRPVDELDESFNRKSK
ncbi:putative ethanolamine utilization protein (EutM) [Melioribacter roseus P3M-2]|uniref:Putative ethanolamine utilization protein (EutM) n=2 Tax=Melioribacteraceae TaxID=1334117 RepID=I6ZW97_MELRP|nr:putative ethanolamine utilization protein (EutM) [Melioribacter roseus P3M-2]